MAWVRTSLGLLTFGCTLYKIFRELQATDKVRLDQTTSRSAGVFLTLAGTAALMMGILSLGIMDKLL